MKRLLFLLTITLTLSLSANSQTLVEDVENKPSTGRIAIPNEAKDTLYIQSNMYSMIVSMWNKPEYEAEKPVFVPVRSLDVYIRRYNY